MPGAAPRYTIAIDDVSRPERLLQVLQRLIDHDYSLLDQIGPVTVTPLGSTAPDQTNDLATRILSLENLTQALLTGGTDSVAPAQRAAIPTVTELPPVASSAEGDTVFFGLDYYTFSGGAWVTTDGPSNMMTTDTPQTTTAAAVKRFAAGANMMLGSGNPPQTILHVQNSAVAAFPTLGGADFIIIEANGNAALVCIPSATGDGIFRVTPSGTTSGGAGTGQLRYNANTNEWFIRINGTDRVIFDATGLLRTYGNQTLAAQGTAPILGSASLTGQSAAIAATNLVASATAGQYRLTWYLYSTVAGNAVNVTFEYNYTDGVGGVGVTTASVVSLAAAGNRANGTASFFAAAATAISYDTTISGAAGAGRYALYVTLERLS